MSSAKQLEGRKFRWPTIADGVTRLSPAQFLLEGFDWSRAVVASRADSGSVAMALSLDDFSK